MAILQQQAHQTIGKKAKLYPTIILCILVGAVFCAPYGLTGVLLFLPIFILYIIYQIFMLFSRVKSMRVWRIKKIAFWCVTFGIGFSVQHVVRISYETKGNEFVQAVENYYEQNGRFPSFEEAHEIGDTLGIGVGSGKSVSYKFFYSLPNAVNPAVNNSELFFPHIFFKSPNIAFETCFYAAMNKNWVCVND